MDFADIERRHGVGFESYFAEALARCGPLITDGLVTLDRRQLRTTDRGRFLLRVAAMCFDRYLASERAPGGGNADPLPPKPADAAPEARFSRVV